MGSSLDRFSAPRGFLKFARIKRVAIDFGGTWRLPPAGSGRGLWEMRVRPLKGLGTMEPKMHKGGLLIAVN